MAGASGALGAFRIRRWPTSRSGRGRRHRRRIAGGGAPRGAAALAAVAAARGNERHGSAAACSSGRGVRPESAWVKPVDGLRMARGSSVGFQLAAVAARVRASGRDP